MKELVWCWSLLLFSSGILCTEAGSFWQINDFHYDPTYGTRNESCMGHNNLPLKFPKFGNYYCDAPWPLVEEAIVKMSQQQDTPDFIVWAGDNSHHTLNAATVLDDAMMFQMMENVTSVLKREFPDIQVYPLLGNHDWLPKNKLPAQGTSGDLYDQYSELFLESGWFGEEQAASFRTAGFYMGPSPDDALRILVLNTNLYLPKNTVTSGSDPGGQFKFMRDQLALAQESGQRVYIFTHVPVGRNAIRSPYDETFTDIIVEYADVISSIHAAHEHIDRFRLIYGKNKKDPVAYQIITPAVTPWKGGHPYPRNPSFAHFQYGSNYSIEDMTLYYLNLQEANDDESARRYVKLYSFREKYDKPLNANSLADILARLKTDRGFFNEHYKQMWINIGNTFPQNCDDHCRRKELCWIEQVRNSVLDKCISQDNSAQRLHSSYQVVLMSDSRKMCIFQCTISRNIDHLIDP